MARSRSSLLLIALALAARAGAAPGSGTADKPQAAVNPQTRVTVAAASSEVNYKTGTVDFKDVVLSQGNTQVRADRANTTCLNKGAAAAAQCANSRWTFEGNVRIDAQLRGSLQSDQAIVEVRDNRIARATVIGNPAQFEQQRADAMGATRGHADQIVYDVGEGTVTLTNDAWVSLSGGSNDITSQQIVYDIRSEKVRATSPGTQGVHITLTPQSLPKQGEKPRKRAPGGPAHAPSVPPAAPPPGAAPPAAPGPPAHS
jgi:lipopolysaccharide transport protein LptA